MRSSQAIIEATRRRLGRLAHDAGAATRADIKSLREELHNSLTSLNDRITQLDRRFDAVHAEQARTATSLRRLEDLAAIDSLRHWLAQVELQERPLVSVVLPTCDRPQRLRCAINSVLDQRYENWELIVVDDGGDPASLDVVESIGDARIAWHACAPAGGACAARNVALRVARGELIAYIDDDNTMDPGWLFALVWAFAQRPESDVLYGGFVVDDLLRTVGDGSGELPRIVLHPFSREALQNSNLTDMGAIAHRAGLSGAWFDESLRVMGDWDLLIRLTADQDPMLLPAIACFYSTDASDRLSNAPSAQADRLVVAQRAMQR